MSDILKSGSKMMDLGDKAGFSKGMSYINKKGTPEGDGASFNMMPPGMDIDDQKVADIRDLPLKEVVSTSYPGDGW